MNHNYIPIIERELLLFAKNLYAYALAHFARWGVQGPQSVLEASIAVFETAFAAFQQPRHGTAEQMKLDFRAMNEAKDVLNHALRTYVQDCVARNPAVTDEDKKQMRLSLRGTTPTHHPAPDLRPETEAKPAGTGAHRVTAVNPHTQNKEKPPLVTGVAFARRVRGAEEPKSRAEDMPSEYQAGTSRTFQYAEADYGKVADYATAYENATGQRGPWSNVTSLLISG
jgi:hypothetical protein